MNIQDFLKLSPENQEIYLKHVDSNLEFAKALRTKAASEAVAQEEDYAKLRAKNRDKVASSYNLMALISGGHVIQSRDDDVIVPTSRNPVKMYAGSSSKTSTNSESTTEKQYALMRLLIGGGR